MMLTRLARPLPSQRKSTLLSPFPLSITKSCVVLAIPPSFRRCNREDTAPSIIPRPLFPAPALICKPVQDRVVSRRLDQASQGIGAIGIDAGAEDQVGVAGPARGDRSAVEVTTGLQSLTQLA